MNYWRHANWSIRCVDADQAEGGTRSFTSERSKGIEINDPASELLADTSCVDLRESG